MAIEDMLKKLERQVKTEVEGFILLKPSGEIIYSFGRSSYKFSTMVAAIIGIAKKASYELKKGELEQIVISSEDGKVIITDLDGKAALAALARPGANTSLILLEMERAGAKIKNEL